jgi:hypothetical protein
MVRGGMPKIFVYNFPHGKSKTVSSKSPRLPAGKEQENLYWFLIQYLPTQQEQKSTIQEIQRAGKMNEYDDDTAETEGKLIYGGFEEPWDYKGLYWDDVNKRFYRWHELKLLWQEREIKEKCQSTAETKEPNLNEK